jgi:hypothetical protein
VVTILLQLPYYWLTIATLGSRDNGRSGSSSKERKFHKSTMYWQEGLGANDAVRML